MADFCTAEVGHFCVLPRPVTGICRTDALWETFTRVQETLQTLDSVRLRGRFEFTDSSDSAESIDCFAVDLPMNRLTTLTQPQCSAVVDADLPLFPDQRTTTYSALRTGHVSGGDFGQRFFADHSVRKAGRRTLPTIIRSDKPISGDLKC